MQELRPGTRWESLQGSLNTLTGGEMASCLSPRTPLSLSVLRATDGNTPLTPWVDSFDGPSAFLATLLILYFCCVITVIVRCCYVANKLSLSLLYFGNSHSGNLLKR